MTLKEITAGSKNKFFWYNILGMTLTIIAIVGLTLYGIGVYTHHGEQIIVPDLKDMQYSTARNMLEHRGLICVVTDTGYVKGKAEGCVLYQSPEPGKAVKEGRVIYITINSSHVPTMPLPDIADNSSMREAQAKLQAMGFKVGKVEYVEGEKDWVISVKVNGRKVYAGDRIPSDATIILQVGDGSFGNAEGLDEGDETGENFELGNLPDLIEGTTENTAPGTADKPAATPQKPANPAQKPAEKKKDENWF